eukprot:7658675-Pyramimonas_sp.AAC.1
MAQIDVRALNTFGVNVAPEGLWTCGIRRRLEARSQIDYICVSRDLDGVAHALHDSKLDDLYKRFRFDHRPV